MTDRAPSPPGLPLLGNTLQYLRDPTSFHERHAAELGDVVRVRLGTDSFHYVTHPEDIRRVLVDEDDRFRKARDMREMSAGFGTEGLFLSEGEQWRRQRTLSQPAFYRERIEGYAAYAVEHARDLAESWTDGERVRIDTAAKGFALGVLTRALFGFDIRENPERGAVVRRAAEGVNAQLDATRPSMFLPDWVPTLRERRFRRAVEEFDAVVADLVAERRADPGAHDDLLAHFVRAADAGKLSERELRDQAVTFLFAGHETTSLALTYTLYLLSENPDAERRLHDEVDERLDGDPSPADLADLPYTERVLKESMRLLPPLYMVLREPLEDVRLRGHEVPAGTTLVLPQRVVQTDDRWWDRPDAFAPDRWAEEDPDRPEYAYFPFGGGPRHCIGMRFAMLELKAALATLARWVRFEDGPGELPLSFAVTLQPGTDVEMTVRRR